MDKKEVIKRLVGKKICLTCYNYDGYFCSYWRKELKSDDTCREWLDPIIEIDRIMKKLYDNTIYEIKSLGVKKKNE